MSSSSSSSDSEIGPQTPHVVRYHCIIRDEGSYDIRNQLFSYIYYCMFFVLRSPLAVDAVRYFTEKNIRSPIIFITSENVVNFKYDRTARLYNTSARHNVLPLKLELRRLVGVPLSTISGFEQQIKDRNAELDTNSELQLPRYQYENESLPLVDEWVGIYHDRQKIIGDILHTTSEDGPLLHFYQVENENGREVFNPMIKRSHMLATFKTRSCFDMECQICGRWSTLPIDGVFYPGEQFDREKVLNRGEAKQIRDMMQELEIISDLGFTMAGLSDASNPRLLAAMAEKKKKEEEKDSD